DSSTLEGPVIRELAVLDAERVAHGGVDAADAAGEVQAASVVAPGVVRAHEAVGEVEIGDARQDACAVCHYAAGKAVLDREPIDHYPRVAGDPRDARDAHDE